MSRQLTHLVALPIRRQMGIDLAAYFTRLGYEASSRDPTLALLRDLQLRHVSQIAFEGLDSFLGVPVDIDRRIQVWERTPPGEGAGIGC